jgi:DNA-binding MarR family transcriptional regulator
MTEDILRYTLEDSLAYQVRRTYRGFVHNLQLLLEQHDIPLGMWFFLRVVWDEDGLTQREISDRAGLVAPTTVEQLRNMEKRGLVERRRSLEDRRKVHVHLTPAGLALKAKVLPLAPQVNARAVRGLSVEEVAAFQQTLARIQDNLNA